MSNPVHKESTALRPTSTTPLTVLEAPTEQPQVSNKLTNALLVAQANTALVGKQLKRTVQLGSIVLPRLFIPSDVLMGTMELLKIFLTFLTARFVKLTIFAEMGSKPSAQLELTSQLRERLSACLVQGATNAMMEVGTK